MSSEESRSDYLSELAAEGLPIEWKEEIAKAKDPLEADVIRSLELIVDVASAHRDAEGVGSGDLPFPSWKHLRLRASIGSGNHGELFRAWDQNLGQEVALKLPRSDPADSALRNKLLEEARRLARVRHENVVRVFGVDIDHGRVGFWMEYVRGKNLDVILEERGPLKPVDVLQIGKTLARGLAAVHSASIIHGDIKPTNVLCETGGRICLVDFSAGRSLSNRPLDGITRGSPLFMARETVLNGEMTPVSDIYGVGVLLFHLLTRRYPIEADTWEELRAKHEKGAVADLRPLPPDLPSPLKRTIERCLEPNPARRFQNAAALEMSIGTGQAKSRHRWLAPGIAALAILTLIAAFYGLSRVASLREKLGLRPLHERTLAQRSYELGVEAYARRDFDTAQACFRDAVGYDSTFAMAYFQWSQCESFWDIVTEAKRLAERAFAHSAHLPTKDRARVLSWYYLLHDRPRDAVQVLEARVATTPKDADAWRQLGKSYWQYLNDTERAIACYRKAFNLDARNATAANDLAYCYLQKGAPDSAVAWARRAIAIQPDEPNPYDTMGDVWPPAQHDSSAAYYRLALSKKADFVVPLEKLFVYEVRLGHFAEAESLCARMIRSDDTIYRAKGRWARACIPIFQGRLRDAERELAAAIDEDLHDRKPRRDIAVKHATRAWVLSELGRHDGAVKAMDEAIANATASQGNSPDRFRLAKLWLLLEGGRHQAAGLLADSLRAARHPNPRWDAVGPAAEGLLALYAGRCGDAATRFAEAMALDRRRPIDLVYLRGASLACAGQDTMAIRELAGLLERTVLSSASNNPLIGVRAWLLLGSAYGRVGDSAGARVALERFLGYWGHRDHPSGEIQDALRQLAQLGGNVDVQRAASDGRLTAAN